MTDNNRNRNSQKGNENENRTGNENKQPGYRKLPDDPNNSPDESISTRENTANGKYSKTNVRDEEIDNDDTRGGR
jgi:hypothetical protein